MEIRIISLGKFLPSQFNPENWEKLLNICVTITPFNERLSCAFIGPRILILAPRRARGHIEAGNYESVANCSPHFGGLCDIIILSIALWDRVSSSTIMGLVVGSLWTVSLVVGSSGNGTVDNIKFNGRGRNLQTATNTHGRCCPGAYDQNESNENLCAKLTKFPFGQEKKTGRPLIQFIENNLSHPLVDLCADYDDSMYPPTNRWVYYKSYVSVWKCERFVEGKKCVVLSPGVSTVPRSIDRS